MAWKRLLIAMTMLAAATIAFTGSAAAALLGVQPGLPQISFDIAAPPPPYATTFDPATGIFRVSAMPVSFRWSTAVRPVAIAGAKSLTIQAHLDGSGNLITGGDGDGIVVTGDITSAGGNYTGTLLTGKITAVGYYHTPQSPEPPTSTNSFDFRLTPTGGALMSQFTGYDVGVTLTSENSTFRGSFASAFQGNAKGTIGMIPGPYMELTASCVDAPAPGEPMQLSGLITNTGSEALNAISCSSSPDASLTGVPTELAMGASATINGSYLPNISPSTGTITCSATGAGSKVVINRDNSAACSILTAPAIKVEEGCSNASAPGQPVVFTVTVTNSGNETLNGVSCSNSQGVLSLPSSLTKGQSTTVSVNFNPTSSPFNDSVSCTATGAISATTVSSSSGAACSILTKPGINVAESCSNASAPGQPITLSAAISNTGNESLTGISCTDAMGAVLSGIPATLVPNASVTVTGSYLPTASPSADTITCSAKGSISATAVSANSGATCSILTQPGIKVYESCSNASAPGQPITISAAIVNTGNEPLTGITCTDSMGAVLSGIPASLAPSASAALSGSYVPTASPSADTITCSANGAISTTAVSANSSASCSILTKPGINVTETCINASAPGQPIAVSGIITNTGNEILTGISCTDAMGAALSGIPVSLAPNASTTLSGSYIPTATPSVDTITCNAKGAISTFTVSASSSATCTIDQQACIQIKKQVSTNCIVTGGKDKHCKSDESKDDYCKRSDCDKDYCSNRYISKDSYCSEVTVKAQHCGCSESKAAYCSKSNCDRKYCGRDESKDEYCKVPPAPTCIPVWLDADTQDSAAMSNAIFSGDDDSDSHVVTTTNSLSSAFKSFDLKSLLVKIFGDSAASRVDLDDDDSYGSYKYYQGNKLQGAPVYRFIVSNCGPSTLTNVIVSDPKLGISNYSVGTLAVAASVTLTSAQIPQLAPSAQSCSGSLLNTATVVATDPKGKTVTASDDAWVICATKSCAFTKGFWKNHPDDWPIASLKLGTATYNQSQLLSILGTPPLDQNGLISIGQQLIAAKLNIANGTIVPTSIQQAVSSADSLIGGLVIPPVGTGSLAPSATSSLTQTLDTYNSGKLSGGPSHCGDSPPQCSGAIGDTVWNDLNKNGTQVSGEPGLAGIRVTLSNGTTTTTDSSGHYKFIGLCKGSYTVKVTSPCGYSPTTATESTVTLSSDSSSNLGIDFGFAKPTAACSGKIGDTVWNDLNKNGIPDSSESGLAGITVTLSNGTTATTDASGHYLFTGLCAGSYTVTVDTPDGMTASTAGKVSPATVTLSASNSAVTNVDFGFYKSTAPQCTGTIGNFIWSDQDKDGIQEPNEHGIPGVIVNLNTGQSTVSDAAGHYQFTGLCAGTYTVTATPPAGYSASPRTQGSSRTADSNGSPATVTLSTNSSSDLTIDMGFYPQKGCNTGK